MPKKSERYRVIAYLPKKEYESLCSEAETTGQSMSDTVRNALQRRPLLESIRAIMREELGK